MLIDHNHIKKSNPTLLLAAGTVIICSITVLCAFTAIRKVTIKSDGRLADTLMALENQSIEAWKHRDGVFFSKFLADDHVEIGASGVAGKAGVVAFVGSPACVVSSYTATKMKVTIFDENTALVTYHAAQETKCNGKDVPSPAWIGSLFVRRNGRWQNAVYQQTSAPK